MDTLANISQNIFAYSFVSKHSKHFLNFETKKLNFLTMPRGRLRMQYLFPW